MKSVFKKTAHDRLKDFLDKEVHEHGDSYFEKLDHIILSKSDFEQILREGGYQSDLSQFPRILHNYLHSYSGFGVRKYNTFIIPIVMEKV